MTLHKLRLTPERLTVLQSQNFQYVKAEGKSLSRRSLSMLT